MPFLPFLPLFLAVGVAAAVVRAVYKAHKRDKKFIESVEASTRG